MRWCVEVSHITDRLAGIDLEDPGFWQKGYDFLGELIGELKGLVEE